MENGHETYGLSAEYDAPMRRNTYIFALALALAACERKAPPLPTTERIEPAERPGTPPPKPPSALPTVAPVAKTVPATPTVTDTISTSVGPVTIMPIRHATLALGFGGKTIVLDPTRQAPTGWLSKADLVLITDIHQDHFDREGIAAVRKENTLFVAPEAVKKDFPAATALKNGGKTEHLGVTIRAVPMYNLKRGPEAGKLFHDKGRGNGYLLGFGDKTFYISGDTECTPEMKALKNIDVAFVCMNLPFTMPVEEAVECVKAFKPKVVIPFHYRGSDTASFKAALSATPEVEVRLRDFYVGSESN
jgi:L-ascorbate metabolism protein UlaG (beta-lactamase superfamily)